MCVDGWRGRLVRFPPEPDTIALQEQLHQDLVVLGAVYHDLAREAAAFGEAKAAIEGLCVGVRAPDLDYELSISGFTCDSGGGLPQFAPDTSPTPGWQEERPQLADMRHRVEQRRPAVESLKANDVAGAVYGDVYGFSRGERFQIASLLLDTPDAVDRGMHPLSNDDGQDRHDPGSVLGDRASNLQGRLKWRGQHPSIQA
jgi:hypothetical protein